jgi:hypothetical protein
LKTGSLGQIFGSKRDANVDWRRFHNEEVHSLYIIRVIKSTRLKLANHVAGMDEGRSAFKILTGKSTGKRHLAKPSVDGRIILEWTLEK